MTPEIYNPFDTSLKGDAAAYLQDPRVTINSTPAVNSVFDITRKQQIWAYPPGTGDVDAFELYISTDKTTGVVSARLIDYFIPGTISSSYNIQSNPSKDGEVIPLAPMPLRQLAADETLVLIRLTLQVGGVVDSWWVRKGSPTIVVPPGTPVDGGFTQADRDVLNRILTKVGG